jgi:hypothetical protein
MLTHRRGFAPTRPLATARRDRHRTRPVVEGLESRELLYATSGNAWPNPQAVTISFMPDGTNLGGVSSNLFATFNSNPSLAGRWQQAILAAAAQWQAATNINFVVLPDDGEPSGAGPDQQGNPNFGDIRIGGYNFNSSTLAEAYQPPPQDNYSIAGDILINTGQVFNIGSTYDLETVAMHEIGHALGMNHTSQSAADTMWPTYTGAKSSLAADDIAGVRSIYSGGNARTPDRYNQNGNWNGSIFTSTYIQNWIQPSGIACVTNLDITTPGQAEYFEFTVPSNSGNTVSISAQGQWLSLLSPQVDIYNSLGQVVAAATAGGTPGGLATLSFTGIQPGQLYGIEVQAASGTVFNTGKYALGLSFNGTTPPLQAGGVIAVANGSPIQGGGGSAEDTDYADGTPLVTGISPDTGSSSTDGITDANRLVITGVAPANQTVTLLQNGVAIGTTTSTASGVWSFDNTANALADGVYQYTASITNTSGNILTSPFPYQVTVNTQPPPAPVILLASPSTLGGATTSHNPTIYGMASPATTLALFASGNPTPIATTTANATGIWDAPLLGPGLPNGTYNLTAVATNVAGDVSSSSNTLTMKINVPVPSPTIGGVLSTRSPAGKPELEVVGTTTPDQTVQVELGGVTVGSTTSDAQGNWSFADVYTTLAKSYSWSAIAVDSLGDASPASAAFKLVTGSKAPVISSLALTSASIIGTDSQGNPITSATPSFSGSATANAWVTLLDGDVTLGTVQANAQGVWTFTSPTLASGKHTIQAEASTSAGYGLLTGSVLFSN